MKTIRLSRLVFAVAMAALPAGACADSQVPEVVSTSHIVVTLAPGSNVGSPTERLPLTLTSSQTYSVNVTAQNGDGTVDKSFMGYVRFSAVPGTVLSVTGPNTDGRNVQLQAGVATNVQVAVLGAYGDTRIWVEDIGYVPADPARTPPPQCANGIDDNGNGLIDYPADPGCAYANDDTEDGGTFATGISDTLYYVYPRIADVRGVSQGGGATAFPSEQVQMDTQWTYPTPTPLPPQKGDIATFEQQLLSVYNSVPGGGQCTNPSATLPTPPADCQMSLAQEQQLCMCPSLDRVPRGVVVTGLSSSGFFVTDVADPRGFSSVFAYNYTAPVNMLPGDRLIAFGGTSADFYGWTEINYPAWELDEWDPTTRNCFIPDPHVFTVAELGETAPRLQNESGLVRVMQNPPPGGTYPVSDSICDNPCNAPVASPLGTAPYSLHIGKLFGPGYPTAPAYVPDADHTNCDLNNSGKIDYTAACVPKNCTQLGQQCGLAGDGCGNTIDCSPSGTAGGSAGGGCTGGQTCGGGGKPNVCGSGGSACVPLTCGSIKANVGPGFSTACGPFADGCGNLLQCGACATGTVCGAGGVANVCFESPEEICADVCAADVECNQYSAFATQQQFNIVVTTGATSAVALANGAASQTFDPVQLKGQPLSSFSGDLVYFSGGTQFTIVARCADDIVTDTTKPPLPSDSACVTLRTSAVQSTF